MFIYPKIDPVLVHIGPLSIHWYGIMYLVGFLSAWILGCRRIRHHHLPLSKEELADLIFYCAVGVIVGGRLGYVSFYQPAAFLAKPWTVFYLWQGGMSFHGGLIGVAAALVCFAKLFKKPLLVVTDFAALMTPLGLAFGRLGNFINGELWGRATDVPWAFVFPHVDNLPRHPSQLYELLLEGILLFTFLWIFARKQRPEGAITGLFLIGYGLSRFFVEFFREPDAFLGFVAFSWMTMGQLLSIPMIVLGCAFVFYAYRYKQVTKHSI